MQNTSTTLNAIFFPVFASICKDSKSIINLHKLNINLSNQAIQAFDKRNDKWHLRQSTITSTNFLVVLGTAAKSRRRQLLELKRSQVIKF